MFYSYGSERQRIDGNKKKQANRWQFWLPWQCSSATRGVSSDGAHPGLHSKPLKCHHRSSACAVSAATMVKEFKSNTQNTNKTQLLPSNYGTFWSLVVCDNFNPKSDHLLGSSMRLELESSAKFLAIKRCQRTKIGKVIKLAQSSILSGPILWAHRG